MTAKELNIAYREAGSLTRTNSVHPHTTNQNPAIEFALRKRVRDLTFRFIISIAAELDRFVVTAVTVVLKPTSPTKVRTPESRDPSYGRLRWP